MTREITEKVRSGAFVTISLLDGPTLTGYAAQDPEVNSLIRLDGIAFDDDESLCHFSLRVRENEIAAIQVLERAPSFKDKYGNKEVMSNNFWNDLDDT